MIEAGAFDGKVALVTGAGIGLATAEAFARVGASVVLADRDAESVSKAAQDLCAASYKAIGVTCDVTDAAQVGAMIERIVSTYGRLDAAFTNAGVNSEPAAFLETSDDEFERVMAVKPARRVELHEG
jgi:NAD(P)-dependent dehydrogenase (short-subunit alcohol dehydrogenase family)